MHEKRERRRINDHNFDHIHRGLKQKSNNPLEILIENTDFHWAFRNSCFDYYQASMISEKNMHGILLNSVKFAGRNP
jgi:hypothetical protein